MTTTLYLLRHGDTGAAGRFIGSSDIPLADPAFSQLDRVRGELCLKPVTKILCSPLKRCLQTTKHLGLGVDVTICPELREVDFGKWEGKTFAEITQQYPAEVEKWSTWSEEFSFPGGEKISDFLTRIGVVQDLISNCQDEQLLVVSHGGVIRQLVCAYLGLSPDKYLLFDIKAGHYSTLSLFSEGGVLTSLNSG